MPGRWRQSRAATTWPADIPHPMRPCPEALVCTTKNLARCRNLVNLVAPERAMLRAFRPSSRRVDDDHVPGRVSGRVPGRARGLAAAASAVLLAAGASISLGAP